MGTGGSTALKTPETVTGGEGGFPSGPA
jgi:hypothetical protein